MQIAKSPVLSIDVVYQDSRIQLSPRGPLAAVARPIVERINRVFADEKPVLAEADRIIFSTWIPPAPSRAFDRMISAQIGAIIRRPVPDQFSIAIFKGCPNRCIHCAAPSRQGEILEEGVINRAIDQALELGSYMITFDGGEPMLRRELPAMAARVDDRAIAVSFTSGYGLTGERARELKQAGLYAVRVSIDSPDREGHDRFRGREGAFDDALQGINNALDAGLMVDLFMVVSPHNIDRLEEAHALAGELGVHELSLYDIIAVGNWASHEDEVLSRNDVRHLEEFHRQKNRSPAGPRVTAFPYLLGREMFGCFAGRRWIHVDASGEAIPCAYLPMSFGNIKEKSLPQIWKEMSSYRWFSGRHDCLMKDPEFRRAHRQVVDGQ